MLTKTKRQKLKKKQNETFPKKTVHDIWRRATLSHVALNRLLVSEKTRFMGRGRGTTDGRSTRVVLLTQLSRVNKSSLKTLGVKLCKYAVIFMIPLSLKTE